VAYPDGTDEAGTPTVLEKSYSPVSHPALEGVVDLLVKAYVPRPGGGVGSFICNLEIGETMQATLKKKRMVHGSAEVTRRWRAIGLVGGGTGIAPLIQIARIVLDDPHDLTTVRMLSINRHEEDILMKAELDAMAAAHPERFQVAYSLTGPVYSGWPGFTGRGSLAMIQSALPPPGAPNGRTMIFVCGTDGFVDTWGGKTGRGPQKADGSKGPKIQGPLTGLLAEAGFHEAEVFKY
jgi:cytochrome-b5 reductase